MRRMTERATNLSATCPWTWREVNSRIEQCARQRRKETKTKSVELCSDSIVVLGANITRWRQRSLSTFTAVPCGTVSWLLAGTQFPLENLSNSRLPSSFLQLGSTRTVPINYLTISPRLRPVMLFYFLLLTRVFSPKLKFIASYWFMVKTVCLPHFYSFYSFFLFRVRKERKP